MSKSIPFPPVPGNLLEELKKRFPDKLPESTIPHPDFALLVGQQRVVRFLQREFDKQNKPKD